MQIWREGGSSSWRRSRTQNERAPPREFYAFRTWIMRSVPCSTVLARRNPLVLTLLQLMILSRGTVPSQGWLLANMLCCATASSWSPGILRQRRSTCALRLLRRLAYEASDSGLLSPELAAGIQLVKGAKRLGIRLGNWLTVEQCRTLLRAPDERTLKGRRDRAAPSP